MIYCTFPLESLQPSLILFPQIPLVLGLCQGLFAVKMDIFSSWIAKIDIYYVSEFILSNFCSPFYGIFSSLWPAIFELNRVVPWARAVSWVLNKDVIKFSVHKICKDYSYLSIQDLDNEFLQNLLIFLFFRIFIL